MREISVRRWMGLLCAVGATFALSSAAQACATDAAWANGPRFVHPAPGKIIVDFGRHVHPLLNRVRQHNGIDYAADIGDPIHAAAGGEVTFAGHKGEFGLAMEIQHADGWVTFYAHLSRFTVRPGDCVKAGDIIGKSGNTGFSVGPHLHFEIRSKGAHIDPANLLDVAGRN